MKCVLALCLALMATAAIDAQGRADLIRVYVVTATGDSGFVDPRLADSRKDLLYLLRREKKTIALVDSAETADVSLEILSSQTEVYGSETTGRPTGTGYSVNTRAAAAPAVRVALRAGTHETVMSGIGGTWRLAAVGAFVDIRKWIKANREQLVAKRP